MTNIPTGTELIRPFIPSKDFDHSKRFYEALGFKKVLDSEVAIFNAGSGGCRSRGSALARRAAKSR